MHHPNLCRALGRARCKDLLREADEERRAARLRDSRQSLQERLLFYLGQQLSLLGGRLRERYDPAAYL